MLLRSRSEIPASSRRSLLGLIPGRSALVWIVAFSMSINMLLLVVPFYSIEVFDRVISSGSVETLVGLTFIAAMALVFSAAFDTLRSRLLSRFAVRFERHLAPIVLESMIVDATNRGDGRAQYIVKLPELRTLLSSTTIASMQYAPFLHALV
jgi:ATP-binding cassette subfamily C protein